MEKQSPHSSMKMPKQSSCMGESKPCLVFLMCADSCKLDRAFAFTHATCNTLCCQHRDLMNVEWDFGVGLDECRVALL